MYLPPHFAPTDPDAVAELIRDHPLATLVTSGADGIAANHIPMQLTGSTLRGHVARNNDVWRVTDERIPVLAIFSGPDAYISPSWYATKRTTHEVVPTWNYVVAHVTGTIRFIDDPKWLRGFLAGLTRQLEAERAEPWRMGDAPSAYLARQLEAIVGVEIEIDRIVAKEKLSQNRSEADRRGVIAGLRSDGDGNRVADAMEVDEPSA